VRSLETTVGAELATRLLGAAEQLQRDVAIAAAVAAVRAARLSKPLLEETVDDLVHHVHVLEIAGPAARPEAVGQACCHITQAWRDALESTFPGRELTVDWDPQERIVTAYSRA
jgi:hypothetical protein